MATPGQIINNEELRIVMVGKTGIGKSATGNTILGRNCFESKFSATSMTEDCSKVRCEVDRQKVTVIDTPGLFDTRFNEEKTMKDLTQCISFASPGPHVFLVVIRLSRFTEEEMKTVQRIQEIFGPAADKYSMVLFTHGDQLEGTIEEFLAGSPDLKKLVARCNRQYHVLNNKSKDQHQVTELLQKIKDIVKKNGGSHYTNEMFQEAERAVEDEKQRILKKKKGQMLIESEELEKKMRKQQEKEIDKIKEMLLTNKERRTMVKKREKKVKEREEMVREKEEMVREREKMVKEREEMVREKEEMVREKEKMVREKEGTVREKEEMVREKEEMVREKEEMVREKEEMVREKEEMVREKEEMVREKEEMVRERKEMEREKDEMVREKEETVREKEEMMREREEMVREKEEMEREISQLREQHEKDLRQQKENLQKEQEARARKEAEESNPIYRRIKAGEHIVKCFTSLIRLVKEIKSMFL